MPGFEADTGNKATPANLDNHSRGKKLVVLLGASIGKDWDVSSLPERVGHHDYVFEYVRSSGFDKSKKLEEVLSRQRRKPDAVFLKECSAYFPGDLNRYKHLMERWVNQCREAGVIPIPATVVPVTRLHAYKKFLIDVVKGRNPFKFGNPFKSRRIQSVLAYNDWIRRFCRKRGLLCLDLEKALRYSKKNRFLREDLARMDGLHINRKGYRILDQIVCPTLHAVKWEK